MKISELRFQIGTDGSLLVPASSTAEMGLAPGKEIFLSFLTQDGRINDFSELLLTEQSLDTMEPNSEEGMRAQIPSSLLVQADIPPESDLQIACCPGLILIFPDNALTDSELRGILDSVIAAEQLIQAIREKLQSILEEFTS